MSLNVNIDSTSIFNAQEHGVQTPYTNISDIQNWFENNNGIDTIFIPIYVHDIPIDASLTIDISTITCDGEVHKYTDVDYPKITYYINVENLYLQDTPDIDVLEIKINNNQIGFNICEYTASISTEYKSIEASGKSWGTLEIKNTLCKNDTCNSLFMSFTADDTSRIAFICDDKDRFVEFRQYNNGQSYTFFNTDSCCFRSDEDDKTNIITVQFYPTNDIDSHNCDKVQCIEKICSLAFSNDNYNRKLSNQLLSVNMPNSLEIIGDSAFYGCNNLNNIVLNEGLKHIGVGAFMGCISLTYVKIPSSVIEIQNDAFKNCTSLSFVEFCGTVNQFNNITLGSTWNENSSFSVVTCSDGIVSV